MQTSTLRVIFQPGVDLGPFEHAPRDWGSAKEVSADWYSDRGMVVIVEGDGYDLEAHLSWHPDIFNSWDRMTETDFRLALQKARDK